MGIKWTTEPDIGFPTFFRIVGVNGGLHITLQKSQLVVY